MARFAENRFKNQICTRFVLALLAITTILTGWAYAGKADTSPPLVGGGSLLYRSPISGTYEPVPLVHTDVAIDVRGLVAAATVTQQYANSSASPVEAVYIFPLPHDAAVYDLEIQIGNRIIRSVIRERQEAKRVYEAAKSEGKHAALLEEERPNIFTTSVANIMPGDHIDVRLRYVEPLRWEEGRTRLVFPMVVGPRYIPGTQVVGNIGTGWASDPNAVSDASRITPPVRRPESRSGHDISLAVDLDSGFEIESIKCVSHAVNARRLPNGRQHVELAAGATIPNKDFVLEVQQAKDNQPKTALFVSPASDSGETQFVLAAFPPTVQPRERMPVEMLYMIDVSGSMAGTSIEQARGALLQALDTLSPSDRFGILAFSSGYGEFASEPLPATEENLVAARAGNESYETTIAFDASKATFHPGITTLWARQRIEELMDHWRHSDEKGQAEIRASVISHAIRYRLVTRFTSLVAVEEVVANASGQSNTVAVPTELPAGWQMDKVFGAPATGTADAFLEALGITLLIAGAVSLFLLRRVRVGALS